MVFPPVPFLLVPPVQAPVPTPPAQSAPAPKADLPPGFQPSFRYVVRPWGWTHLGSVGPKEKIRHTWEMENLSDRPIGFKVSDLAPGVLVLDAPFATPIPGHAKRAFTIQVDADGWEGYQQRGVRLVSDDPSQPNYKVLFDMTVRPDLTVDGVRKSISGIAPYESPQVTFRFTRETGDPLELTLASTLPPYVESEIVPQGDHGELRLTLRASKVPVGQLAGLEVIKVTTNAPRQPSFDLYLDWSIHLPVTPEPSRVVFSDPAVHTLELTLKGDQPFKVLKADLQAEGFSLGTLPAQASSSQVISLHRDRDDAKDGRLVLTLSGVEDPLVVPVIWANPHTP